MNAKHSPKTYCIVCKKDTENINPKVFKLSSFGIRTPLLKIPLLNILSNIKHECKAFLENLLFSL